MWLSAEFVAESHEPATPGLWRATERTASVVRPCKGEWAHPSFLRREDAPWWIARYARG